MYDKLLDIFKRRGIAYPSFEVYGGVSGFIDYGPVGSRIKQNLEDILRRHYIIGEGCFEVQCPTLSPEEVWVASGHVEGFTDVTVECVKCGESYRADRLLGEAGVEAEGKSPAETQELLTSHNVLCPKCESQLSKPYEYNLMFQTTIGAGEKKKVGYLRPETAQSTYLGFKRLWEYARKRLPFGVIQIGRSFRNEISPRQGMIRLREFNQAEIQFFLDPEGETADRFSDVAGGRLVITDKCGNELKVTLGEAVERGVIEDRFIAYHLGKALEVFADMGVEPGRLRLRQHPDDERAFYSNDTWDVEYVSEVFGRIELVGIADRGDYDLRQHMAASKKDMRVSFAGRKFVPHVVEVAYGIDRPFYCVLESSFREDDKRAYFSLPKKVAPYEAGVYSLVRKDGIEERADMVFGALREAGLYVFCDHAGSIGKRYARADEIGVPYCVTVDYDTLTTGTVTVRNRDTKMQERIKVGELVDYLKK
jgi:glycyl-tRNA synthetase